MNPTTGDKSVLLRLEKEEKVAVGKRLWDRPWISRMVV